MPQPLRVDVVHNDVLAFPADVLALKYAQGLHGADLTVAGALDLSASILEARLSRPSSHYLVDTRRRLAVPRVLFVGVERLSRFRYAQIRQFAGWVLSALMDHAPETRNLAVTIHGPNYGLDEREAFTAQLAGFLDAHARGDCPAGLERITFVELNAKRVARLREALSALLPAEPAKPTPGDGAPKQLRSAGADSEAKPHVFVAMPFADEFDDIYHYGIEPPVRAAGYLCERADTKSFAGHILEWIKHRIETAAIVIADLSTANPNVYLEVGYAWGLGRPTILLTREVGDLKFDMQSQRCLIYKRIRDLEESLRRELEQLRQRRR